MTEETEKAIPKAAQAAMERLGWMFVSIGPDSMEWRKFDSGGAPLAAQGDNIWSSDLASCMMAEGEKKIEEKEDIVRVLRILEYVGPRAWVEATLEARGVKEKRSMQHNAWISEAFLERFP